jgi:putative transcriptional regulator
MAKRVFEGLKASLEEALSYAKGEKGAKLVLHRVEVPTVDVKAARKKMGMSQIAFAETFDISLPTLRKWEQKKRTLSGPARALMRAIEAEPEVMKRVFHKTAVAAKKSVATPALRKSVGTSAKPGATKKARPTARAARFG